MKKILFLVLLTLVVVYSYAQKGDLYIGGQGDYITMYKDFGFGIRGGYNFSDPFQVNLIYTMTPTISMENSGAPDDKAQLYNMDLNLNYYILNNKSWGMSPVVGLNYLIEKMDWLSWAIPTKEINNLFGLNLGWDIKYNVTEAVRLHGSWKYSILKDDHSHHTFSLGIGYYFNVF